MCWYTMLISLFSFEIWTYFHKHLGHLAFLFHEVERFDRVDSVFPKAILHCSNMPWIIPLVYGLIFILFISFVVFWWDFMIYNFLKFVLWCHVFFQNFQFYLSHWSLYSKGYLFVYYVIQTFNCPSDISMTFLFDQSIHFIPISDATLSYTKSL